MDSSIIIFFHHFSQFKLKLKNLILKFPIIIGQCASHHKKSLLFFSLDEKLAIPHLIFANINVFLTRSENYIYIMIIDIVISLNSTSHDITHFGTLEKGKERLKS
jgi:hypothetical protein